MSSEANLLHETHDEDEKNGAEDEDSEEDIYQRECLTCHAVSNLDYDLGIYPGFDCNKCGTYCYFPHLKTASEEDAFEASDETSEELEASKVEQAATKIEGQQEDVSDEIEGKQIKCEENSMESSDETLEKHGRKRRRTGNDEE